MAITCPANSTLGICGLMEEAGAGLGIFIQYIATALPTLLIVLAIVGIIVAVGVGIAAVIRKGIGGSGKHY